MGKAVLISLITLLFSAFSTAGSPLMAAVGFDAGNAYRHAEYLTVKIGPRPPGSQAEYRAAEYIGSQLRSYGWQVSEQEFSQVAATELRSIRKRLLVSSRNVVAVLPGETSQTVIIGAHYDSADFNVPGAEDNASGIGVLLELGRFLAKQHQRYTYILVGFAAEEAGLVGSRYFAGHYDLSQVRLMINLDMVGSGRSVALDGGSKISAPPWLMETAYRTAKQQGLQPEVKRNFLLLARDSRDGGTSDFSPFLDKWIPSIGLGKGGKTPGYFHQPTDTLDKLERGALQAYGNYLVKLLGAVRLETEQKTWSYDYFPIDTGIALLILPGWGVKLFVFVNVAVLCVWLALKREKCWLSLGWLIPVFLVLLTLTLLAGAGVELAAGRLKGYLEPWHAHPLIYFAMHGLVAVILLYLLIPYAARIPAKFLPRKPVVYRAGALLLLGVGTVLISLQRLDFAAYLAFWSFLLLAGRGPLVVRVIVVLLAPLPVYGLHWELNRSYLWNEFYRTFSGHPVIFSLIYGFGLLPLLLPMLALILPYLKHLPKLRFKAGGIALLCCGGLLLAVPAYSDDAPQALLIREEWQQNRLLLVTSSADTIPRQLARALGGTTGTREIKTEMNRNGASQPMMATIDTTATKLGKTRLITVRVNLDFKQYPYSLKLKLRSEQPFTLVNGGQYFPRTKGGQQLKLEGEPTGGIYGLILEKTPPSPSQFTLYFKAEGKISLSLETYYAKQFVPRRFNLPATQIKYENVVAAVQQI
ncbi:MAG TPA: M28 family metallopeptidase [Desulfobacteria bacterium]|nr:M28 family metallopeptidase [Desulfobacteria bacterium]